MSYILDALKRSEQERHQERSSSIGNDLILIPKNKSKVTIWPYLLVVGLLANAGVFFYLFNENKGEESNFKSVSEHTTSAASPSAMTPESSRDFVRPLAQPNHRPAVVEQTQNMPKTKALPAHLMESVPVKQRLVGIENISSTINNQAPIEPQSVEYTDLGEEIIRPKEGVERRSPNEQASTLPLSETSLPATKEEVIPTPDVVVSEVHEDSFSNHPLLSELPIAFQRKVPSITFSSHIYSTEPSARRAMINNLYMREGDGFSGLVLKEIGEFYVLLDKQGEIFKIPVLRDWQSP